MEDHRGDQLHDHRPAAATLDYQALLVLSFGGPEGPDDVIPFLENVTRGRNVPRERLEEVAEHYYHFGGKSPINEQNRALIQALEAELGKRGIPLPIYFGNRNWYPLLPDTLEQMKADGIRKALVFITSAFSSYSGCRQYRENIEEARQRIGEGAPHIDKLRNFYNHPGFLLPMAEQVEKHFEPGARLLFSAHSIPSSMAQQCRYEQQLQEASRLVAELAHVPEGSWEVVYQSRSGPPHQPWLEPDVLDRIRHHAAQKINHILVVPIGFISDHMEVLFDLDTEAVELAQELDVKLTRLPTVGTDRRFVSMIADLIEERLGLRSERASLGVLGPSHDVCPPNCCLMSAGRPA